MTNPIKFDDGAAYERYMGRWSQLVGVEFLRWLSPSAGLRWLDVGCGNGAFTELIISSSAPASVDGVDPSEAQLAFARSTGGLRNAKFHKGDAMALPFEESDFDVAVMPLVIFFVPDPLKGVTEMKRVVRDGGIVAAYAWDLLGGGFPYQALQDEMRAMGLSVGAPPNPAVSRLNVMQELWTKVGLASVETRAVTVQRTFGSFDDFWATVLGGPSVGPGLSTMKPDQSQALQNKLRMLLPADADGRITYSARAHAIKGHVAKGR